MNQEFKKEWVNALRNGEYTQGKGVLNRFGKCCCLGVACELLVKKGVLTSKLDEKEGMYQYGEELNEALLPAEAIKYMGIGKHNPTVKYKGYKPALSSLNDSDKTFLEIADLIEAQL